jgi:two-component system, sensor histidine kinase and response regulator
MTTKNKIRTKKKTVLFIDDEGVWLTAIKMAVKEAPFKVITAEGGERALKELHRHKPDLILSDVRMPDINGFDLFEKVKLDPTLKSIPYVFMSSIEDFDAKRTAKQIGADGYIEKPFNSAQIKSVITGLLKQFQGE